MPAQVQDRAFHWYCEHGRSVYATTLAEELELRDAGGAHRVVDDASPSFVGLVPFAALSPFYTYVVPTFDSAHFEDTPDAQLDEFAEVLHRCLRRVHVALDEPDFNLVLRSAPVARRGTQAAYNPSAFYRWHATLFPRIGAGAMAGFEFASGIFSNAHMPEDDAATLRATAI